jgi:hypothetical protein
MGSIGHNFPLSFYKNSGAEPEDWSLKRTPSILVRRAREGTAEDDRTPAQHDLSTAERTGENQP